MSDAHAATTPLPREVMARVEQVLAATDGTVEEQCAALEHLHGYLAETLSRIRSA